MEKQMVKKSIMISLIMELFFVVSCGFLFKHEPIIWIFVTLILSTLFSCSLVIPYEIDKSIKSGINKDIGKHYVIKRLNGFSNTLSMNGELLVLSEDNKFYRVSIKNATISDVLSLNNNTVQPLV